MKAKLWAGMAILLPLSALASTYYISSGGQNSNDGSKSSPWETIQYATFRVVAGDSVIVLPGIYKGFVLGWDESKNGTPNNQIVFQAEPGAVITSKNNTTNDGIDIEGSSYIVIDGFTISNIEGSITNAGIRSVGNTGIVLRNNTITSTGTSGIYASFSDSIIIENNSCSNSKAEHGIHISNGSNFAIIRNNKLSNNNISGLHLNIDKNQNNNGTISNALIEGNTIYDNNKVGGAGIFCDGVQNSTICNNLLYNNHNNGISLIKENSNAPSTNNLIVNNSIYMSSDAHLAVYIANESINNQVLNNIIFSKNKNHAGLHCELNSLTGFQSDYNIVTDKFTTDGGNNILSLNDWRKKTGQDENSRLSSPNAIFQSPGSDNYRLIKGCHAIDNGTSNNAPTKDIEGYTRAKGSNIDIGAYEYIDNNEIKENTTMSKL